MEHPGRRSCYVSVQKALDSDPSNILLRDEETVYIQAFNDAKINEERFLRQKAKIEWLDVGDSNSAHFHKSMKSKNQRNRIEVITISANVVVTGNEVPEVFVAHYESFLAPTTGLFVKHVSEFSIVNMVRQVSNDEIKRAMFDIGDGKSPRPDGYTLAFFKKGWDVVGSDVCRAVREFFDNGKLLKEVNHTFLALIPKVNTPMCVNDFRPISCCNVLFKCISKILTNRIIEGIKDVVSENQSAFVPGRCISDNILLTHELMHNYHLDHGQPRCAFKVDIQKAYDTVDWRFLGRSSFSLLIYVGDGNSDFDAPKTGDLDSAKVIIESLDEFKLVSGLVLSIPKSTVDFCNVASHVKLMILNIMPFPEGILLVQYLGVPLISYRLLNRDCKILVEKARNRIRDWKNKSLSFAGRLQLCKSRGKAKVAWDDICLPIREGGLGLRCLEVFNLALMTTHIWHIISNKELLWVRWIHTYKLRGHTFWDIYPSNAMSWGWRKLLQLREIVKPYFWKQVGNGLNTSLWFDRWCIQGPLIRFLSPRDIAREGYTLKTYVANLIANGAWNWPMSWLAKAPTLSSIVVPLLRDHVDKVYWRSSNGSMSIFSVKLAWEVLRPRGAEVGWCLVVWFSHCVPRHAFNLWLIMRRCLKTQDNLRPWDVGENVIISSLRCSLCNLVMDSHEHLFFECVYSSKVWRFVHTLAGMESVSPRLKDIVDWLRPMAAKRTFKSIVGKLILAATAYFIWSERNNRLFNNVRRSLEELNDLIMVVVHFKLTTFCIHNNNGNTSGVNIKQTATSQTGVRDTDTSINPNKDSLLERDHVRVSNFAGRSSSSQNYPHTNVTGSFTSFFWVKDFPDKVFDGVNISILRKLIEKAGHDAVLDAVLRWFVIPKRLFELSMNRNHLDVPRVIYLDTQVVKRKRNNKGRSAGNKLPKGVPVSKGFQVGKELAFQPKATSSNGNNGTHGKTNPKVSPSKNTKVDAPFTTKDTNNRQQDTGKKKISNIASPNLFAALGMDDNEEEEVENIWDESENLNLRKIEASTPAQTVNTRADDKTLFCSFVYADNYYIDRNHSAGGYEPNAAMRKFKECVQAMEVADVNNTGLHFTWNKKPNGSNGILKKIDRIIEAQLDEERFLKQKAKIEWLKAGDSNTAYFHKIAKSKYAKNRIEIDGNQVPGAFVTHYNQFLRTVGVTIPLDDHDLLVFLMMPRLILWFVMSLMVRSRVSIFLWGDDRASGPDGFATFFKKAWDVVGGHITCAVRDFFSNGKLLKEHNHTIISLIPKVTTYSRINDYRPISCYNVIYKCISKIIANKVKEGLGDIVSINQSVFVPGRRIFDNILLTQELMRNYHRKRGPRKRGLRQGDPLSPYLFTLVMEILTLILQRRVLGLIPSIPKSTTFFCNVPNAIKASILNSMPFAKGVLLVRYLGVPLISSRLLYRDCKILVEKLKSRLNDWRNKFLSLAGREMKKRKAKVAWDSVCMPKHEGGLGICRIDDFNVALMATIFGLQVPLLFDDIDDTILWRDKDGVLRPFSMTCAEDTIRTRTDIVDWCGKMAVSILSILVLAATSYYIWLERNGRLFKKKTSSPDQIVDVII
nr:hypothetical protein [Tanacetum cinerariifolium]